MPNRVGYQRKTLLEYTLQITMQKKDIKNKVTF